MSGYNHVGKAACTGFNSHRGHELKDLRFQPKRSDLIRTGYGYSFFRIIHTYDVCCSSGRRRAK